MKQKYELPEGFVDLSEEIKPIAISFSKPEMEDEEDDKGYSYPSLYFDNVKGLEKLKKEGMAIIHYKKVMERNENIMRNGKNEKRHSVELCICGIKPECCEEIPEIKIKEDDDEDAIEMGLKAAEGKSEENEEDDED
jgi:hypothetical protein